MSKRKSIASGPNKGTKYEVAIFNNLKSKKLLPEGITPAGATDKPDVYVLCSGDDFPLEIKDPSGDFAQIELRWNPKQKFFYSRNSKNSKFIPLLEETKFLEQVNKKWKDTPRKFTKDELTKEDHEWDQDHFKDIRVTISTKLIEQFYNSKTPKVNYIQICNKGFFYMTNDPARLDVPRFSGEAILRARVKTRDLPKIKYGFLVAIKIKAKSVKPSTHDIEEKDGRIFPFKLCGKNPNKSKKGKPGALDGFLG